MAFAVSAPGKTILFGEHSVVHNKPAIAAAVGLRTFMHVEDHRDSNKVALVLEDMGLRSEWTTDEIPFVSRQNNHTELDTDLVEKIETLLDTARDTLKNHAALAFLYLYAHLCEKTTPGKVYTVRSLLPVGAGLGSSASYSVCCATALMNVVNEPVIEFDTINPWAFLGEKCIHGNPSGIDNAVAVKGGALYFQRTPAKLEQLTDFPAIKLLLTNTKVPRSTKQLVANVGDLHSRLPKLTEPILEAMAQVVGETAELLEHKEHDMAYKLAELARVNHGLLVALGVSHPSLERVKSASDELKLGETKLTGAGGGGCAITIVTDSDHDKVDQFKQKLDGYEVFETTLGSQGAGVATGLATTSNQFTNLSGEELAKLGNWMYY